MKPKESRGVISAIKAVYMSHGLGQVALVTQILVAQMCLAKQPRLFYLTRKARRSIYKLLGFILDRLIQEKDWLDLTCTSGALECWEEERVGHTINQEPFAAHTLFTPGENMPFQQQQPWWAWT